MMFSYVYSNWIYFILLLYNPRQRSDVVDHGVSHRKSDGVETLLWSTGTDAKSGGQCDDSSATRIDTFIMNCVQNLMRKLDSLVVESNAVDIELKSVVATRDVHILRQYLPQKYESLNCEQLEEFEETVHHLIDSLVPVTSDYNHKSFAEYIINFVVNVLQLVFVLSALVSTVFAAKYLLKKWWRRPLIPHFESIITRKSLCVTAVIGVIVVCIAWKWRQKYLIELSRKQCYVLQTPHECLNRHNELTFVSWIRHYMYSYEQRRHDYYRAVTVDPFWEINPLTVISELTAELVLTPLKSLGHFSGLFMSSYFSHIPIYLVIPVFIFLCFCTLLLVLLLAVWLLMPNRYSIRIPFLMTIQFERRHRGLTSDECDAYLPSNEPKIVRKYQINASVVNVYHSLPPNNTAFDNSLNENQIQFDENLVFNTNKPISIPYSEVD